VPWGRIRTSEVDDVDVDSSSTTAMSLRTNIDRIMGKVKAGGSERTKLPPLPLSPLPPLLLPLVFPMYEAMNASTIDPKGGCDIVVIVVDDVVSVVETMKMVLVSQGQSFVLPNF